MLDATRRKIAVYIIIALPVIIVLYYSPNIRFTSGTRKIVKSVASGDLIRKAVRKIATNSGHKQKKPQQEIPKPISTKINKRDKNIEVIVKDGDITDPKSDSNQLSKTKIQKEQEQSENTINQLKSEIIAGKNDKKQDQGYLRSEVTDGKGTAVESKDTVIAETKKDQEIEDDAEEIKAAANLEKEEENIEKEEGKDSVADKSNTEDKVDEEVSDNAAETRNPEDEEDTGDNVEGASDAVAEVAAEDEDVGDNVEQVQDVAVPGDSPPFPPAPPGGRWEDESGRLVKVSEEHDTWLYSLHYETPGPERGEKHGLRAAAATVLHRHMVIPPWATPIFHLFTSDSASAKPFHVVVGNVTEVVGSFGGAWYSTVTLYCDIRPDDRPTHVAFSWPANNTLSPKIPVLYPDADIFKVKRPAVVCYSVLYNGYDGVDSVRQNLEFVQQMGATHAYIYVERVGPGLEQLFKYYQSIGFLTVLWMPRTPVIARYWYYGQSLANYDCHHRTKLTADYVAFHDHDEFILPLKHATWLDAIRAIDDSPEVKASDKQVAAYTFQHKFFCKNVTLRDSPEWTEMRDKLKLSAEEEKFIGDQELSIFQRGISRGALNFWDFPRRSKTIIKPRLIKEVFTHMPRIIIDGAVRHDVDNTVAFLAHYWKLKNFSCVFYDFKFLSFLRKYLERVMEASKGFDAFVNSKSVSLRHVNLPRAV